MNLRASADFQPGIVAAVLTEVAPRAIAATNRATQIVAASARGFCPVDKGELQASIGTETVLEGLVVQGSVVANAPYAAFVEYGTGLRGEAAPHGELPTEGVPFTGEWVYDFRQQDWRGMAAQPFLRPALDTNHQAILGAFASEGFYI